MSLNAPPIVGAIASQKHQVSLFEDFEDEDLIAERWAMYAAQNGGAALGVQRPYASFGGAPGGITVGARARGAGADDERVGHYCNLPTFRDIPESVGRISVRALLARFGSASTGNSGSVFLGHTFGGVQVRGVEGACIGLSESFAGTNKYSLRFYDTNAASLDGADDGGFAHETILDDIPFGDYLLVRLDKVAIGGGECRFEAYTAVPSDDPTWVLGAEHTPVGQYFNPVGAPLTYPHWPHPYVGYWTADGATSFGHYVMIDNVEIILGG